MFLGFYFGALIYLTQRLNALKLSFRRSLARGLRPLQAYF